MSKPGADPTSGISLADALRLPKRRPAYRRHESQPGSCTERENLDCTERENLDGDAKGKSTSGYNREAESTDAPARGGLLRSSDEAGKCPWSEGGRPSPFGSGQLVLGPTDTRRNPMFNGRRQPSCDGTSRMTRECQVRICEGLGVKFPGPTRQNPSHSGSV